jgi:hypothetical protein
MKTTSKEIKCKNGNLIYEFKFIANRQSRSMYAYDTDYEAYDAKSSAEEIDLPEIGKIYMVAESHNVGSGDLDLSLRFESDNGEGWGGNSDRTIKRYHGWRGTSNNRAFYAMGVRKCLAAKITGFRSKKVRIVFGKDFKKNQDWSQSPRREACNALPGGKPWRKEVIKMALKKMPSVRIEKVETRLRLFKLKQKLQKIGRGSALPTLADRAINEFCERNEKGWKIVKQLLHEANQPLDLQPDQVVIETIKEQAKKLIENTDLLGEEFKRIDCLLNSKEINPLKFYQLRGEAMEKFLGKWENYEPKLSRSFISCQ